VPTSGKGRKEEGEKCVEGNSKVLGKPYRKVVPQVAKKGKERGKDVVRETVKMW